MPVGRLDLFDLRAHHPGDLEGGDAGGDRERRERVTHRMRGDGRGPAASRRVAAVSPPVVQVQMAALDQEGLILAETHQPRCASDCTGPVNMFACAHICRNIPKAVLMETHRPYCEGWYGSS